MIFDAYLSRFVFTYHRWRNSIWPLIEHALRLLQEEIFDFRFKETAISWYIFNYY